MSYMYFGDIMGDFQIYLWGSGGAKKLGGWGCGVKMCLAILNFKINEKVNFCVFDFYFNLPEKIVAT